MKNLVLREKRNQRQQEKENFKNKNNNILAGKIPAIFIIYRIINVFDKTAKMLYIISTDLLKWVGRRLFLLKELLKVLKLYLIYLIVKHLKD